MGEKYPLVKFLIFAVVCVVFAAWLVSVIGNISFENRTAYVAEFSDVQGLLVNDAVKVNGVTVGKVTGLHVEDGKAIVDFNVRETLALGEETTIDIRWRSILGQRFVYVNPAGSGRLDAGHRFPDEVTEEPASIGVLLERLTPFMRALDPEKTNLVVQAFSEALVDRVDEVQDLIRDGASLTQTLADRDTEIASLLRNANTVVGAYADREAQLRELLDSFAEVAETIAARNDGLEGAIVDLADGQSELRRFIDANDAELRATLAALDDITTVLSVNHPEIEEIVTYLFDGVVSYHETSRRGQWFDIEVLVASSGGTPFSVNPTATVKDPHPDAGGSQAAMRTFFGADGRLFSTAGGR